MAAGYVYIVKDISLTQCYKIGHTNNPSRRVYEFAVQLPFQVMVVMLIKVNNPLEFETMLHREFAYKRTNGEWFKLTDAELTYARFMVEMKIFYSQFPPDERERIWNYLESKRLELEQNK